jgi:hypothetical protein
MNLKSFGCSFIFGSELADDGQGKPYATPSQLTWPAHLARHLGYDYECHASPGAGNLQITEAVLNQLADPESSLYVIGWTWIDRFDYYPVSPNTPSRSPWRTVMPIDEDPVARMYYRDLHSEYRDKLTTLIHMQIVLDALIKHGHDYIITYMDDLTFDQRWHTTPAVLKLQAQIEPHITQFEGQSFLEWSRANGYPETANWHPLEAAHCAAGDYMIKVFDKQKIIDPTR